MRTGPVSAPPSARSARSAAPARAAPRPRCASRIVGASALVVLAVGAPGCALSVRPPVVSGPTATVFIADYGYHASLVLPRPDGRLAEFAYGEWEWFARGRDEWYRAAPALLWPSRGALGTRDLAGPLTAAELRRQLGIGKVHAIEVEAARAAGLLARLDRIVAERADQGVHNPEVGLTFVPHPDEYWLFYQCNTMMTHWLRELGCRVDGCSLIAEFDVRDGA